MQSPLKQAKVRVCAACFLSARSLWSLDRQTSAPIVRLGSACSVFSFHFPFLLSSSLFFSLRSSSSLPRALSCSVEQFFCLFLLQMSVRGKPARNSVRESVSKVNVYEGRQARVSELKKKEKRREQTKRNAREERKEERKRQTGRHFSDTGPVVCCESFPVERCPSSLKLPDTVKGSELSLILFLLFFLSPSSHYLSNTPKLVLLCLSWEPFRFLFWFFFQEFSLPLFFSPSKFSQSNSLTCLCL